MVAVAEECPLHPHPQKPAYSADQQQEHAAAFQEAFRSFVPQKTAVLGIVVVGPRVLLIRKKRGLGAGKLVPPGGHVEAGETPAAACIRELAEELRITPLSPEAQGIVDFQFRDGLSMRVHIFVARAYDGDATETDEAAPVWCEQDALPFGEMWADDPLWLPQVLSGRHVRGQFLFESDTMLFGNVEVADAPFTF